MKPLSASLPLTQEEQQAFLAAVEEMLRDLDRVDDGELVRILPQWTSHFVR